MTATLATPVVLALLSDDRLTLTVTVQPPGDTPRTARFNRPPGQEWTPAEVAAARDAVTRAGRLPTRRARLTAAAAAHARSARRG